MNFPFDQKFCSEHETSLPLKALVFATLPLPIKTALCNEDWGGGGRFLKKISKIWLPASEDENAQFVHWHYNGCSN